MNSRRFAALALAAALAVTSIAASAEDRSGLIDSPSPGAMALDLVLVRPLGFVATVLGTVAFVVQAPFALMLGESPIEPAQKLVVEPARFTFTRRLGTTEDR